MLGLSQFRQKVNIIAVCSQPSLWSTALFDAQLVQSIDKISYNTDNSLDYCNCLLYGVSGSLLKKFQAVQNSALRVMRPIPGSSTT